MKNYRKSLAANPQYINNCFLLSSSDGASLYRFEDDKYIQIRFDVDANIFVNAVSNNLHLIPLDMSLRAVGEKFLGLEDPSVPTVLSYLVTPEMEVERIMNCLRYCYINAVALSDFNNYKICFHSDYNKAFQSLAGCTLYQGNTRDRKDNDFFWRDKGFEFSSKNCIDWLKYRNDLSNIIKYIKKYHIKEYPSDAIRSYVELIAIRPGFHEFWLHDDYYAEVEDYSDSEPRSSVLRRLRKSGGG